MEWNLMAGSAIIALIPAILITVFGQKYITKGLYM
jgi:multiple sugar transport system permease protein